MGRLDQTWEVWQALAGLDRLWQALAGLDRLGRTAITPYYVIKLSYQISTSKHFVGPDSGGKENGRNIIIIIIFYFKKVVTLLFLLDMVNVLFANGV